MSPLISDVLQNPSQVLLDLYDLHKANGIDNFPRIVSSHFQNLFRSKDALEQIPTVNLSHPPETFADKSLVLFNGMVQDTSLSPELYLAVGPNGQCGGWGITDDSTAEGDVEPSNLREYNVIWGVSIPGLSAWCYNDSQIRVPFTISQPTKFPMPNVPHVGLQLKVYDDRIASPVRTTDLLAFVGILTFEAYHSNVDNSNPPVVPTLHVLFANSIPSTIIPRSFPEPSLSVYAESLRNELIRWVADEGLGGDIVVAEWVILSAISRTRSRQPPVLPLSLTISNFPTAPNDSHATPALYHVLSQLFPLVVTLPLALDTLNRESFNPISKDEELQSGFLQQPNGTIVLLSEGAVTEGSIVEQGAHNLLAIQNMMKSQTIDYIFPYSNFSFETDLNFIVITEGKKSTFFKTDVNVVLKSTAMTATSPLTSILYKSADSINLPRPEKLSQFRQLLGGSKIGNVALAESLGKHVENDFVKERLEAQTSVNVSSPKFTADDLILRMLVARLTALSLHEAEVTVKVWDDAKGLERRSKRF